jgi:hypothetical protein
MAEKTRREILSEAIEADEENTGELQDTGSDLGGSGVSEDTSGGDQGDREAAPDKDSTTGEEDSKAKLADDKEQKAGEKDPYKKERIAAAKDDKGKSGEKDAKAGDKDKTASDIKAPNSWKPAEREHWAKIPKEAQQAIQRRELEVQQTLSKTATVRRWAEDFANVIAPYSHLIRAQNSTPLQAIQNLMQTSASLTVGSSRQKANVVAQICRNFNVDVKELDDELSKILGVGGQGGERRQEQDPNTLPPAFAQALKPIYDFMGNIQSTVAERDQQLQQNAVNTVEDFLADPKNEFAEDLRDEMADIMEMKAARGQKVTIQQAYMMAVRQNPDIEAIVQQRTAAGRANSNNVSRARRAASTISGSPSGGNAGAKGGGSSRRDVIREAMNAQDQ